MRRPLLRSSLDRRRFVALLGGCAACGAGDAVAGARIAPAPSGPAEPMGREASWWRSLGDGRVECQLCPQSCAVADAERGMCGVRENRGGRYVTLVHGAVCSAHVDPVEKKPLFHVLPGSTAFSFATAGCNVECTFCQNWEISQFRPEQVDSVHLEPTVLAAAAKRSGARLTAATYSEPVVFWEYVRDVAVAARKAELRPVVISNGFIQRRPLEEVLPLLDAVKVDLKSFSDRFYQEQVRGRLQPVLESLETIRRAGVWLEIVVLLIPTLNDSDSEIRALVQWVVANLGRDVPVHFTRFHPTYRLTQLPPTPVATLDRAWQIGRAEGLRYVYVGNVPGHAGESTMCPRCGAAVVRRVGFRVVARALREGRCAACGEVIPGLWS